MKNFLLLALLLRGFSIFAADAFHATTCEGIYPRHLQGICTNDKDALYWCWTDFLVKTARTVTCPLATTPSLASKRLHKLMMGGGLAVTANRPCYSARIKSFSLPVNRSLMLPLVSR